MTLEDFFTLTEMKNGLGALARVDELISMMQQQQKDGLMNNVGDMTRQRSIVANTLAATENKDCLNHFVKLNGISFLNQWLQEALKCSNDIGDKAVEELMHALLGSLEKLPIDRAQSIASGICMTVEKLHLANDLYKEKAISLCEGWKNAEKEESCGDGKTKYSTYIEAVVSMPSPSSNTADDNPGIEINKNMASSLVPKSSQEHSYEKDESSDTRYHIDGEPCESSTLPNDCTGNEVVPCLKVVASSSPSMSPSRRMPKRSVSCNSDFIENKSQISEIKETLPRSASADGVDSKCRTMELKSVVEDLHNGSKLKDEDDKETSFNEKEIVGRSNEAEELGTLNQQDSLETGKMDQKTELEEGEIDALEIATQVAMEAEHEVVDCREPSRGSSLEGNSGKGVVGQSSINKEKYNNDKPVGEDVNENVSSSSKDETPKVTEAEAVSSAGKSQPETFDFDLNEDIGNEELDSMSVSVPIAASASIAAPTLLITPNCFEGEQGLKGSSTIVLHPTSPRTHSGQKRKANLIEFDLNVMEIADDDAVIEPITKATTVSSDFSTEVTSGRADRLKLDLNRLGDDDFSQDQASSWRPAHQNGERTQSPASSSSSRQPVRDFDLNDNPSFFDSIVSHEMSGVTIMGSRMVAERNNSSSQHIFPQMHSSPSVASTALNLNVGSSQSFLDLNSGMSTVDTRNRDVGSINHVFMQR